MYVFGAGQMGGVGDEWVRGLGLGFTNPGGTGEKWDMCLCFGCVCGIEGSGLGGLGQGLGGGAGVKYVFVVSLDYLC